uniref:Probable carboxypeptidase X1 n=1 Tax=Callorhinchus milii TaxID=7868 RepID=A0A4W3HDB5_CALMI
MVGLGWGLVWGLGLRVGIGAVVGTGWGLGWGLDWGLRLWLGLGWGVGVEGAGDDDDNDVQMMKMVAARCPNITRLYSIGRSFQGRKLHVMEMSDRPGEHELGEGEVGGGKGLLLQLMQFLCEEYLRGYDMNHNFADLNSILWEEEERWPDPSRVLNHYIPIPAYYTSPNASVSLSYTHSQYNNNYIPISNYLAQHPMSYAATPPEPMYPSLGAVLKTERRGV